MAPLNDEYAQADNNNPTNRSRDNPFRAYEPVDNEGPAPSDEGDQAFVAFLITMQDGFPVDFEKENFGNQRDAESYIQTIKNSSSSDPHPQHSQNIEGYAVPKSQEHAAEQELIKQINGVEEGEGDEEDALPKSDGMRDTQGAYFAGQGSGGGMAESTLNSLPEIFEELEDVCKGRVYPTFKIANYLMKVFEITQAEANILARAYNSLRG